MASPVTIGGVTILAPDQGDSYAWGAFVKAALAQVAASCLQTTGGNFPLTADLNLGPTFGVVAPYFKSTTAQPALTGQHRLARGDGVNWRNVNNSKDVFLTVGDGVTNPADQLGWSDTQSFGFQQLTGQPTLQASSSAGQALTNGAGTDFKPATSIFDSDNGYNSSTGVYTIPPLKGGIYLLIGSAIVSMPGGTSCQVAGSWATSGGTQLNQMGNMAFTVGGAANVAPTWCVTLANLTAGTGVKYQVFQSSGAGRNLTTYQPENYICIKRLV